ncbi:MAG: hypothetical protein V4490_02345 [Pseudomonadota bacterium]
MLRTEDSLSSMKVIIKSLREMFVSVYQLAINSHGEFIALDGSVRPLYSAESLEIRARDMCLIKSKNKIEVDDSPMSLMAKNIAIAEDLENYIILLIDNGFMEPVSDEWVPSVRAHLKAGNRNIPEFIPKSQLKLPEIIFSNLRDARYHILSRVAINLGLERLPFPQGFRQAIVRLLSVSPTGEEKKKYDLNVDALRILCSLNYKRELFFSGYQNYCKNDSRSEREIRALCSPDSILSMVDYSELDFGSSVSSHKLQQALQKIQHMDETFCSVALMKMFMLLAEAEPAAVERYPGAKAEQVKAAASDELNKPKLSPSERHAILRAAKRADARRKLAQRKATRCEVSQDAASAQKSAGQQDNGDRSAENANDAAQCSPPRVFRLSVPSGNGLAGAVAQEFTDVEECRTGPNSPR